MLKSQMLNRYLVLIILLLFTMGCAGQQTVKQDPKTLAWKILMTDKQVYDTTFKTLALLDSQGKLPATVKSKAIQLGNQYMALHNIAVRSLMNNEEPAMTAVKAAFEAFLTFVTPFTLGG